MLVLLQTMPYMPPEMLCESRLTQQTDVYSFAMIMWELFTSEVRTTQGASLCPDLSAFVARQYLLCVRHSILCKIFGLIKLASQPNDSGCKRYKTETPFHVPSRTHVDRLNIEESEQSLSAVIDTGLTFLTDPCVTSPQDAVI